ncbi:MAG: DUF5698 domain-containing protein [Candidatus Krumholzibacteriia bacterium]
MTPLIPPEWLPPLIFLARVVDVSLGTLRTITVVQGRVLLASVLGFCEVSIWIVVITEVMKSLDNHWNMLGWALGFAAGNAVGIMIERRLALGHLVVRVLSRERGDLVATALRTQGQRVTEFAGHDPDGEVMLLYLVVSRPNSGRIMGVARAVDPDCVVVSEDVRGYQQAIRPIATPRGGWRSIAKKK